MDVFEYSDFRGFLRDSIAAMPKAGHGQNKRIAEAAAMSSAFFSQVLADKRQLSPEQALLIAEHLGLNDLQSEYFLLLVELDRAGNQNLIRHLRQRQARMKKTAQVVVKRFTSTSEVSERDQPIYYSDWYYTAVQQLTAISEFDSEFKIAQKLDLPIKKVKETIGFLLAAGLCIEKNGRLAIGPARTHLTPDSPWIKQHHANWRARALENFIQQENSEKLHYSSPMTLARADYDKVRALLVSSIEAVAKIVDPSPSEELVCLNIDWFKVGS